MIGPVQDQASERNGRKGWEEGMGERDGRKGWEEGMAGVATASCWCSFVNCLICLPAVHIWMYTGYDKFEQAANLMKQDKVS